MYNESAAQVIIRYMEKYLFEPGSTWPPYWFEQRTYSRWAANEILEQIMDHPMTPPEFVIEEFMFKMDLYSRVGEGTKVSRIFSIARDVAKDILYLFI